MASKGLDLPAKRAANIAQGAATNHGSGDRLCRPLLTSWPSRASSGQRLHEAHVCEGAARAGRLGRIHHQHPRVRSIPGRGGVALEFEQLLRTTVDQGASDLHLRAGRPPLIRVDGKLHPLDGEVVSADWIDAVVEPLFWT